MLTFASLTGRRGKKEYTEPYLIASPTSGEFKITPKVAEQLELKDGSMVAVAILDNKVYIAKGKEGTPLLDEEGNIVRDKRGRQKFEEDTAFGVIVRATVPGGNLFKFTSSKAWHMLGGNKNENIMFTIGEGVEGELPEEETKIENYTHKAVFYPLVEASRKAKTVREAGVSEDKASDAIAMDESDNNEEEELIEEV